MKKRIKFRLRNDLALPFWTAVFICFAGAAVNTVFFKNSFFRALSKLNEEPIATITFKYKTAQRKFLERVVWDRLRQNSPVYNGDTIHTAELSEATIWFDDGTMIELAENTMAQFFRREDGRLDADLAGGFMNVDSSEAEGETSVNAQNVRFEVKKGAKINAGVTEENNVTVNVEKGSASFEDGSAIEEGESILAADDEKKQESFFVSEPAWNQKYLHFENSLCRVNFSWKNGGEDPLSYKILQLVIAEDKNFNRIVKSIVTTGVNQVNVELPKGNYYWQLYDSRAKEKNDLNSKSGKFQIVQSLKPELLAPAEDYKYQYRTKNPSLRFIWTEAEASTAYNFAVSRNADMTSPLFEQRTSSSSAIISTLKEGIYYWQVTPFYMVNRQGLANSSEIHSFRIDKKDLLNPPLLRSPLKHDFVNRSKNKITFSWAGDSEASSYRLKIASSEGLNAPLIQRETSENYITLTKAEVQALADGEYFWGVSLFDSEGNESEVSEIREFYAINGKIEQKTIFPPDEYQLWQPLTKDTRFTWKTNLTFAHHFQLAKDKDFNEIITDTKTNGTSFSGIELDVGEYWWRIFADEANFKHGTEAKKLVVVDGLASSKQFLPSSTYKAVVRPQEEFMFTWEEAQGADYYRLKIYRRNEDNPVYDQNFITGSEYPVKLDNLDEGTYRWELQSFCQETQTSSRRSGRLSSTDFELRKIRPAVLVYPPEGKIYEGWDAIEKPEWFEWKSPEKVSTVQITLKKTDKKDPFELVLDELNYRQRMPALGAGKYEWTVKAWTIDNLDISSVNSRTFTVKELPPFDMPKKAYTEGTDIFDAARIRKSPQIVFKWDKVNRAYDYILEIYDRKSKCIVKQVIPGSDSTSFEFKDLMLLKKGKFEWTVRGVRMSEDKKIVLIDGIPARGTFTVDFELRNGKANKKQNGDFYAD